MSEIFLLLVICAFPWSHAAVEFITMRTDPTYLSTLSPYNELAVSNKRHCHYLCTTESTCKSMKFDETSGICSLYDDEAPIIMPGSSDTVAAFSLPKLSVDSGRWYTALRSTESSGDSIHDIWLSSSGHNEDQPELASRENAPEGTYKSSLVENAWDRIRQVRISIHVSGVEQFYMEFNAFGADKIAWFDRSRQISSSSSIPASTGYFSMIGLESCRRRWYIHTHAGCDGDYGWLGITDCGQRDACCTWDTTPGGCPGILFTNDAAGKLSGSMDHGDVFMIQVLM